MKKIKGLLVANRSEIAIRVLRAASEMDIRTVAIFSNEDRFALHRFKADESYLVGAGKKSIQTHLDIADIIASGLRPGSMRFTPATGFCPRARTLPMSVWRLVMAFGDAHWQRQALESYVLVGLIFFVVRRGIAEASKSLERLQQNWWYSKSRSNLRDHFCLYV